MARLRSGRSLNGRSVEKSVVPARTQGFAGNHAGSFQRILLPAGLSGWKYADIIFTLPLLLSGSVFFCLLIGKKEHRPGKFGAVFCECFKSFKALLVRSATGLDDGYL